MELQIKARKTEQAQILDVEGEVDLYSSPTLRKYMFTVLKEDQPPILIINLSSVTYMDSSGIATLVEGLQLSDQSQTRLKLVGLSPIVQEVFQLVRLEKVFAIYPTEEDALREDSGSE